MSGTVFAVVLLAAVLHAGWNALVKGGADKTAGVVAVTFGQGLAGLLALPLVAPLDWVAWVYVLVSVGLHLGYQVFLLNAYRFGDLTQVYPIARGVAPLLVAVGSFVLLGVTLGPGQVIAVGLISIGIASISLVRRSDGQFQGKAALLALGTGVFIAAYSLVDGTGARIGGAPVAFFAWVAILNSAVLAVAGPLVSTGLNRRALRMWRHVVIGGAASFIAYAMVVWAFTQAPIALVTALRETSVIFALLIGVGVLGERLSLAKVAATALTLTGAVLLRVSRG